MEVIEKEVTFLPEFNELFNPDWRNIVFEGGRYSGKSYHVALALLSMGRKEKLRILCTREIQNTIRDSVHKLLSDIVNQYGLYDYDVQRETIINNITGSEFIFKGLHQNILEIKSLEGVDKCWVEEAQSVTEESLDILGPTIRKPKSQMIFTFNRYLELDPVYVKYILNKPAKTYHAHVNFDVLENHGMISDVIKLEIEQDKVNDYDLYAHKWLGQPLAQPDDAILSRTQILAAMERKISDEGLWEAGIDVARFGHDRTVIWLRKGLVTKTYKSYQGLRTTEVCDKFEKLINEQGILRHQINVVKVDETGIGSGVVDELAKRQWPVRGVNNGGEPYNKDKYPNVISEAWFYLKSVIDKISLPYDDELLMELSNRLWKIDNKSRRIIESKEDYKKRGWRSPDLADACILAYYNAGGQLPPLTDEEKELNRRSTLTASLDGKVF